MNNAWTKELRQAFQEAVIRGQPFTVHTICDRVRELFSSPRAVDNVVAMDLRPASQTVEATAVKAELLALMERERPREWALITIPVVNEDGTPQNVWQFTPFNKLEGVERANLAKLEKPTLFQRMMAWMQRGRP